ncbi:MAG: SDR family NAD(P)-dependent oxidoreductase [Christensenellaceae bacterium]|jgi:short-subunit dehydrogenase|nr:SDR family NAD(P)-dependent oxidoreductase [Christensenellaceae bacterium]
MTKQKEIKETTQKVAIITGGSSGIGLEISKSLIKRGYKVYAFGLDEPADKNLGLEFVFCDVSKKEVVDATFTKFFAKETRLDVLINNAGMGISGAAEFNTEAEIRRQLDVNFFGAVWASQAVIAKMREQGFGKIGFISSCGSVFALPFQAFYSASKSALQTFAEGLSTEVKPFGIDITVFMLGDIKSGFTKNRKKNEAGEEFYGARIAQSVKVMEKDEQNGMSASVVGEVIGRVVSKRKSPPLIIIGAKYKLFCFLNRLLPKRLVLWVVGLIYGGKS